MSKLVGVDIGTTTIRVVEVAGVDAEGFALISRIGLAQLPPGAVIGGRIRSTRDVSVGLVRALRAAGVQRQGFVLGLSSPEVALTTMVFPSTVRASERDGAIRAMGRPLGATFGLESSAIATYLAGSTSTQEGITMSTIGVAAAMRDDVTNLETVCDLARCSPLAIDLSGAALLRSLTRVNPSAGEVGTIVDVGASKVLVATRQGMYLRSLRTTVGAGDEVSRAIASANRSSFEDAEQAKYAMRLSSASAETFGGYGLEDEVGTSAGRRSPADAAFSSSVDLLVDSIAQSIEADASNFNSMSQGVNICGGTALLRGFKDRLQQRLGIPVANARPRAEIERSRRNAEFFIDGRPDPRLLLTLSTAVGLALWKEPM